MLFPLFVPFLQLSLLILLFSYVLCDFYFSHTFTRFQLFAQFLGKWGKLVLGGPGDPGTPGNVKVIAGDCQRSLEIVDNSTLKKLPFSLKVAKHKLLLVGCFEKTHSYIKNMHFLGRRKYH